MDGVPLKIVSLDELEGPEKGQAGVRYRGAISQFESIANNGRFDNKEAAQKFKNIIDKTLEGGYLKVNVNDKEIGIKIALSDVKRFQKISFKIDEIINNFDKNQGGKLALNK